LCASGFVLLCFFNHASALESLSRRVELASSASNRLVLLSYRYIRLISLLVSLAQVDMEHVNVGASKIANEPPKPNCKPPPVSNARAFAIRSVILLQIFSIHELHKL
jgi:hypothetical protein